MKPNDDNCTVHGCASVIDYAHSVGVLCKCGKDVMFTLRIHDVELELCERCVANIAHCAIDALE